MDNTDDVSYLGRALDALLSADSGCARPVSRSMDRALPHFWQVVCNAGCTESSSGISPAVLHTGHMNFMLISILGWPVVPVEPVKPVGIGRMSDFIFYRPTGKTGQRAQPIINITITLPVVFTQHARMLAAAEPIQGYFFLLPDKWQAD